MNDEVLKVRCIDNLHPIVPLTIGKEYKAREYEDSNKFYEIITDDNGKGQYCFRYRFEIIKEENIVKKYNFREAIANIKENEKWTDRITNISMNDGKIKIEDFNGNSEASYTYGEDYKEFIKEVQPVTFIEAITSNKKIKVDVTELNNKYKNGNHVILNNYWNNTYFSIDNIFAMLSEGCRYRNKIINEGKWFIQESEVNE